MILLTDENAYKGLIWIVATLHTKAQFYFSNFISVRIFPPKLRIVRCALLDFIRRAPGANVTAQQ